MQQILLKRLTQLKVVKNGIVKKTDQNKFAKMLMLFRLLILEVQLKKLTMTQRLMELKRKYLMIIMINILLLKNLMS